MVVGGRKPIVRKKVTIGSTHYGAAGYGEEALQDDGTPGWEKGPQKRRFKFSPVMLVMIVLTPILALGGIAWVLKRGYSQEEERHQVKEREQERLVQSLKQQEGERFRTPEKENSMMADVEVATAAHEMIGKIKNAETVEALLPYVRKAEEVGPLIERYYAGGRGTLPIGEQLVAASELPLAYDQIDRILIFTARRSSGEPWWLVFEETDNGPKLDWKSFVRYSGEDVFEFLNNRTTAPTEFRVLAMIDDYFNFEYAPAEEWICVRIFDPEESFVFYGYAKRQSPLGAQLIDVVPPKEVTVVPGVIAGGGGPPTAIDGLSQAASTLPGFRKPNAQLTLKLAFREGRKGANQVEIVELIRESWYVP